MDNRLELIKELLKRQQELRDDLTEIDNTGESSCLGVYMEDIEEELDSVDDRIAELKGDL